MVRLDSELTIYQAAALKPQLIALVDTTVDVDLDLGGVTEFDSAGYQLLALLRRDVLAAGRTMRVTAMSGPVRELLDLYGATGAFTGAAPSDD